MRVETPGLRGGGFDKLQEESGRVVGAYLLPAHPTLFPAYFTIPHPPISFHFHPLMAQVG